MEGLGDIKKKGKDVADETYDSYKGTKK